jgi:hypothetical protein
VSRGGDESKLGHTMLTRNSFPVSEVSFLRPVITRGWAGCGAGGDLRTGKNRLHESVPPSPVLTAPPAVAAACGRSAPDRDPGYEAAINPVPGYSGPAMRTGPDTDCQLLTRIPWGTVVPLNCYRFGDTVNGVSTWTAVHYNGYFGWVSDYHLSHYGSSYAC